jgi:hypothetical protein
MKSTILFTLCLTASISAYSNPDTVRIASPNNNLVVSVCCNAGHPNYSVANKGKLFLEDSPLGMVTNLADFTQKMTITGARDTSVTDEYTMHNAKASHMTYNACGNVVSLRNDKGQQVDVEFLVADNSVAFRYLLPQKGDRARCTILREATGFNFPGGTTTFLCPQVKGGEGWMRTKPSYEEEYQLDAPLGKPSREGLGFTFPCLFHEGAKGWVLVSETGVDGYFCGSHLSDGTADGLYTIAYPDASEFGGIGDAQPSIALPGQTPWRTLTIADNLKPIVETTVQFDVVKPRYAASQDYRFGRSTWSWILWQDASINYDDQVRYIDLSAAMGYEYCLVDGGWMKNIGREGIARLAEYAKSKGVSLFLWYNSNGYWNDAPQDPKGCMDNIVARHREMAWMKSLGVKGIKVDFFGSDKQQTMGLYEEILADANDYGLMVIFHGCTIPRGWERMYPNYVASEAVLASENLIFSQHFDDVIPVAASLHPFVRNAVGGMEFGGTFLNHRMSRDNQHGQIRRTGDVFELATAVLFQSPIQNFALAPNNLTDTPALAIDFMRNVPTTWDETRFVDGYPGRYIVLARRHADNWYVAAVNAEKAPRKLKVALPMLAGRSVNMYLDLSTDKAIKQTLKIGKDGIAKMNIPANCGVVITDK